jgi:hypothetical protein
MTEVTEVERLRARVAELEAQVSSPVSSPDAQPRRTRARRTSPWWAVLSATLVTVACLLAPLSVASVWARTEISDADRYVKTVAPLIHDPAVQHAIANEVTATVFQNVDVRGLTTDALNSLAQQPNVPPRVAAALPALAVPITNGVQSFVRTQVNKIVASPQFATVWDQVNRIAHQQVVKLLEGNQGGAISAQGNNITLNLGPLIAQVKDRLVARGFTLASNIPTVHKSFVLVQSDTISRAQGVYRLLNTLGVWLPFAALALFAAGVAAARDHRRALLRGALGVTAAMLLLGGALAVARSLYVGATPADVLTPQAAGDVFDTLVRFLRTALRTVAVLGLIVALGAFLTGPSAASVRTRATLERGIGSLRGGAEAAGWQTGRVGTWTYAHKRALRITVVILGGLVLTFWTRPTVWVVIGTALAVLLAVAVIEFLSHPPVQPAAITGDAVAGPPEVPIVPRQMPRTPTEPSSSSPSPERSLQPTDKEVTPHA